MHLGPVGVSLDVDPAGAHLDAAAEIEELGYATIWLPGGQLDRLDRITELVRATRAIPIAPGIIPVDVYSAEDVARWHARLAEEAPGRVVVGLGGPQRARPLQLLGQYLDELDAADPPVPAERRLLAALGPRKLALARDRAAGAVPLLVDPAYTAQARAVLGAERTLVISQLVVLDENPARSRDLARKTLGFLSGVRGYRAQWLRLGFTDDEIDALADRLVDELVAWGGPEAVIERVRAHRAAGADQVVLSVLSGGSQPGPLPVARMLADTLLRTG